MNEACKGCGSPFPASRIFFHPKELKELMKNPALTARPGDSPAGERTIAEMTIECLGCGTIWIGQIPPREAGDCEHRFDRCELMKPEIIDTKDRPVRLLLFAHCVRCEQSFYEGIELKPEYWGRHWPPQGLEITSTTQAPRPLTPEQQADRDYMEAVRKRAIAKLEGLAAPVRNETSGETEEEAHGLTSQVIDDLETGLVCDRLPSGVQVRSLLGIARDHFAARERIARGLKE